MVYNYENGNENENKILDLKMPGQPTHHEGCYVLLEGNWRIRSSIIRQTIRHLPWLILNVQE